jgi:digeranylgeranylglycerophospholipid reductase
MKADRQADVVVVGAGPSGSMAALRLAGAGARVMLVDKREQVGLPVRCAEAVGREGLQRYVSIRPRWISARTLAVRLHAPSGEYVHLSRNMEGLVLDRKAFDGDLAREAAEAGADVILETYAAGLLKERDCVTGVRLEGPGGMYTVGARLVIAADGVESRVARWAGIDTALALKDVESCGQYLMDGLDIDPRRCDFYFGRQIAPGGYAWVFPKGPSQANVGLGISGQYAIKRSAKELLDQFVDKVFPHGKKRHFVAGGVPISRPLKKAYAPGLLVVGDAARQSNPLSGGGIIPALEAGQLAAQVTSRALAEKDVSAVSLSRYQRAWKRSLGRSYGGYYRLKEAVSKLSDETLNATASALSAEDPRDLTLFKIFITALRHHPRLILDIRHLFLPAG